MKVRQLSDSQGLSYVHLVMLSLYAILLGVLVGLIDAVFGRVLIGLSEFVTIISFIWSQHFL